MLQTSQGQNEASSAGGQPGNKRAERASGASSPDKADVCGGLFSSAQAGVTENIGTYG